VSPTKITAAAVSLAALVVAGCVTASSNTQGATVQTTTTTTSTESVAASPTDSVAGQYLTVIGGCNDCHTPSWEATNGKTPPAEQLTGSSVGFRGPWGTSYPANLRNLAQRFSEDRWVQILTTAAGGHGRPPMPWMNTAAMTQHDLRVMYRYIHALGPRGVNPPRGLPADSTPHTPYINFVPVPAPAGG
jgi:hypothetical protein